MHIQSPSVVNYRTHKPIMTSLSFKHLTGRGQRDYSPVSWTEYFDEAHDVRLDATPNSDEEADSFRVYLKNFHEPYAPDHWRQDQSTTTRTLIRNIELSQVELQKYEQVPTLVTIHGGGYSALTWAKFAGQIETLCKCRILTLDLRGHGDTKTSNDNKMDIDSLVTDVTNVIHQTHQICGFSETPKVILIGHSMGGAIAIKCSTKCLELLPSLVGFVIIDVVEGTAKDALPLMMSVIKTRPRIFPSLSNAIEWSVRSGMAKNSDAARVSMPGNLLNIASGCLAIHDIPLDDKEDLMKGTNIARHKFSIDVTHLLSERGPQSSGFNPPLGARPPLPARVVALREAPEGAAAKPLTSAESGQIITGNTTIDEEDEQYQRETPLGNVEDNQDGAPNKLEGAEMKPPQLETTGYTWRIDLAKTQPFWSGWFEGLSAELLEAPVQGKFLLLAGIDRLDKTLTIGQMQGKFMMKVLPKCGHAVHEDVPDRVAQEIGDFLVRNKFTLPNNG